MANIRTDVNYTIVDGAEIIFKAPCDSCTVTGLKVYYPNSDGIIVNEVFAFKDAHGNDLTDLDTFKANAMVKVILNTTDHTAYIQNADTNAYLEGRFDGKANTADLANYLPLSGGQINSPDILPIRLNTTASGATEVRLPFMINGVLQGYLAFDGVNSPVFISNDGVNRPLLHGGNYSDYTHQKLAMPYDTRSEATSPSDYTRRLQFVGLKETQAIGLSVNTTYVTLLGLNGWDDHSGSGSYELAFCGTGEIYMRRASSNTTWGEWREVLNTGNVVSYTAGGAYTLTGRYGNEVGILNNPDHGRVQYVYNVAYDTPGIFPNYNNANSVLTLNRHYGDYTTQLGFSSNESLYHRSYNAEAINTSKPWREILDTGNSAKVSISSTAPGDANALWVW